MIALFNFRPTHCPHCGQGLTPWSDPYMRHDYDQHCAFYCRACDLYYQYVETPHLLTAATAVGGDLADYRKEEP